MCGILGEISSNIHKETFLNSLEKMNHRGPDNTGFWFSDSNTIALGHKRLSIIDLTKESNQPMFDKSKEFLITFNGEIYNYREIKNQLLDLGITFNTDSDTEVLLEAYKAWNKDCLNRLVGMYAFAIYDIKNEEVFLARDRAGEKPLFYYKKDDNFIFSSELKSMLSLQSIPKKIDVNSLDIYLAEGFVPGDRCIVKGVNKLPAGHYIIYNLKKKIVNIEKYWRLPYYEDNKDKKFSVDEITDQLGNLIQNSVKNQLHADVPVGVLLSGGLDSSLVTAYAVKSSSNINTFTIRFPSYYKYDETKHARLIADYFATNHVELEAEPSTIDLLPKLAKQFDEPIMDSSMIPTYLVSKLVRERCTVALGGDGGDELFGGYKHYSRLLTLEKYSKYINKGIRTPLSKAIVQLSPKVFKGLNWIKMFGQDFMNTLPRMATYFDLEERKLLLKNNRDFFFIAEADWESRISKGVDVLDSATRTDFYNYMPEDILVKVDRASMLNSIEMRAPMLDHRIIEFAFKKIPTYLKANDKERKIILKKIGKKILPPEFDYHRKQGFSIPLDEWFKTKEWINLFESVMYDSKQIIFNKEYVKKLLSQHVSGIHQGERLFGILMFELWRKEYNLEI